MRRMCLKILVLVIASGGAVSADPLTEQRFADKTLQGSSPGFFCNLTLQRGGRFKYSFSADSPTHTGEGTWSLAKGTLSLIVDKTSVEGGKPESYGGFKRATCKTESSEESIEYSDFLVCEGEKSEPWVSPSFILPDSALKPGTVRTIDGVKVVLLEKKKGIPTTSLMFRKKPTPDGEIIDVRRISNIMGFPFSDLPSMALPAGVRGAMVVFARTEQKARVGQWENYWLYVEIAGTSGWVFGEFVKITDQK